MKTQCSSHCPEGLDHGVPDPGEHVLITEIEGEGWYPFGIVGHALYSGGGGCDVIAWPDGPGTALVTKNARIHWLSIDDESTPEYDELTRWSQVPIVTFAVDLAADDEFVTVVKGGPGAMWVRPAGTQIAWHTQSSEAELRERGLWREGDEMRSWEFRLDN